MGLHERLYRWCNAGEEMRTSQQCTPLHEVFNTLLLLRDRRDALYALMEARCSNSEPRGTDDSSKARRESTWQPLEREDSGRNAAFKGCGMRAMQRRNERHFKRSSNKRRKNVNGTNFFLAVERQIRH